MVNIFLVNLWRHIESSLLLWRWSNKRTISGVRRPTPPVPIASNIVLLALDIIIVVVVSIVVVAVAPVASIVINMVVFVVIVMICAALLIIEAVVIR